MSAKCHNRRYRAAEPVCCGADLESGSHPEALDAHSVSRRIEGGISDDLNIECHREHLSSGMSAASRSSFCQRVMWMSSMNWRSRDDAFCYNGLSDKVLLRGRHENEKLCFSCRASRSVVFHRGL
jgi:hypothetical protein